MSVAAKQKRKRWSCPMCSVGVLGPIRPRKDNAIRYCLPCTEKTGKLTERVCLSDLAKKERKQEAKNISKDNRKKSSKPRNTKRSWLRDERYIYTYYLKATPMSNDGDEFNIMEVAEKMCKSQQWNKALSLAAEKTKRSKTSYRTSCLVNLWDSTMQTKGSRGALGAIRISRASSLRGSGGLGGNYYGVSMTGDPFDPCGTLVTLLHEITHVIHMECMGAGVINGKRRPHDMAFNLIMSRMAKAFWGYDFHPYEAGYSVGTGYAPTRHLESWLREQRKSKNIRILRWLGCTNK